MFPVTDGAPWTRQPQYPAPLDRHNPLISRSLEVVYLGSAPGINLADYSRPTVSGTQFRYFQGSSISTGFNNSVYYNKTSVAGTAGWTIAMVFYAATSLTDALYLCGTCDGPSSSTFDRQIFISGGNWAGYLYDGSAKNNQSTVALQTGRTDVVIVATDGANLYVNATGIEATPLAVSNAGYNAYANPQFCVGNSSSQPETGSYGIPLLLRLNRCWTRSERMAFFENPWQIFEPLPQIRAYATTAAPAFVAPRSVIVKQAVNRASTY